MKNKILLCVFILFICVLFLNKFVTHIVWINPNVNTKVYRYIAPSLKQLDRAVSHAALSMKTNNDDIKVLYQNAYGSGFIRGNNIPNDLDYSVGIYLGKYDFNGKNSEEIANKIYESMTGFETEMYSYINTYVPEIFYTDKSAFDIINKANVERKNNIKAISQSIPKLFNQKDYVVYTDKTVYTLDSGENGIKITLPFILNKNEILIEDYSPIEIYTELVKYSTKSRKILREISVVTTFYADIQQGEKVVRAELVAESFTGQRLQLTRRFYVPIIFVNNNSAEFLKNLDIINKDEEYIYYRMFNFRRHAQEISNLKVSNERPIKLLKRLLQCKELIEPILPEEIADDISKTVEELLGSNKIKLINDYETAYSNWISIISEPYMYRQVPKQVISNHISQMNNIVEEMIQSKEFDINNINEIKLYTEKLGTGIVESDKDLSVYYEQVLANAKQIFGILDKETRKNIPEKVYSYMDIFTDIMKKSGFHLITIGWIDKDLIGVVKDDFTSKIPQNELKKMAKENRLIDVNYKLVNEKELQGLKIRYKLWVRYNSSEEENNYWSEMYNTLMKDKKRFNIKHKFVIPIFF